MREKRVEIYKKLKENADLIKSILKKEELNVAELDSLLRERNNTFFELKKIFNMKDMDEEEEKFAQEMIDDNNYLLEEIERIKSSKEKEMTKKEKDAKDISRYGKDNLIG